MNQSNYNNNNNQGKSMDKQGKTLIAILVVIVLAIVGYQLMAAPNNQAPGEQLDAATESSMPAATPSEQAVAPMNANPAAPASEQAMSPAPATPAEAQLQPAGQEMSEEAQKLGNRAEDAVTTSPAEASQAE